LTGFHHHQDSPRPLQRPHKLLKGGGPNDVLTGAASGQELLGFGEGAVVNDGGVTIALCIEHEIFSHHTETDQAEMCLAHGEV
jgi:hypothetical protein